MHARLRALTGISNMSLIHQLINVRTFGGTGSWIDGRRCVMDGGWSTVGTCMDASHRHVLKLIQQKKTVLFSIKQGLVDSLAQDFSRL